MHVVLSILERTRWAEAAAALAEHADIRVVEHDSATLATASVDVVVVDPDVEHDPAGLPALERLARSHRVVALTRGALRTDLWMLRSCGLRGAALDPGRLADAVRAVAAGNEHWPPGLAPEPGWVTEPFQRRVCAYIRSRERAKFARLIHDNVLQTVEGLAVSPAVDSVGRGLLVREGTRLRELVDAYRTDRLVGAA